MENSIAIGIVFRLLNGNRITAKQISEDYEVSVRTVYRYIDQISASGIPLVSFSGKNGGIELDNNYVVSKDFFTFQEAQYLLKILKKQEKSVQNSVLIEKITHFFKKI